MLCAMDRVDFARCIRRARLPESRGGRTGSAHALGRRGCLADVAWRRRGDRSSRARRRRRRGRRGARRRSARLARRARRRCCDGPGGRPASLPSLPPQSVRCQPCRLRCRRSGPVRVQAPGHGGPAPARGLPCRGNPCRGAAGDERKPVVPRRTLTPTTRYRGRRLALDEYRPPPIRRRHDRPLRRGHLRARLGRRGPSNLQEGDGEGSVHDPRWRDPQDGSAVGRSWAERHRAPQEGRATSCSARGRAIGGTKIVLDGPSWRSRSAAFLVQRRGFVEPGGFDDW